MNGHRKRDAACPKSATSGHLRKSYSAKGVMVAGDEVALIAGGAVPARRNNGPMLAVVFGGVKRIRCFGAIRGAHLRLASRAGLALQATLQRRVVPAPQRCATHLLRP